MLTSQEFNALSAVNITATQHVPLMPWWIRGSKVTSCVALRAALRSWQESFTHKPLGASCVTFQAATKPTRNVSSSRPTLKRHTVVSGMDRVPAAVSHLPGELPLSSTSNGKESKSRRSCNTQTRIQILTIVLSSSRMLMTAFSLSHMLLCNDATTPS